jgi:transcriptional regulator with XRE-family HTH domain
MSLLRRHLGAVLRRQRQRQARTLRDVAGSAAVSLGYLSEIERGHKEASSELLASICDALGLRVSDVLRAVADDLAVAEPAHAPLLEAVPAHAGSEPEAAPALEPVATLSAVGSPRRRTPRVAA